MGAPDPLDHARLKVVRAQEHLDTLKAELRTYLEAKPYTIVRSEDDVKHVWTVEPHISEPPVNLRLIVGDILSNIRAPLDYIIWELVQAHHSRALTRRGHRNATFPIYTDAQNADFIKKLQALSDFGVPAGAIDQVKAVQPYNSGYEPMDWLHHLVNEDKHRVPALVLAIPGRTRLVKVVNGTYTILGQFTGMGYLKTVDSTPGAEMQVHTKATLFVTAQSVAMPNIPIDSALEQIVECVANIIPRFEPFLP